MCGITPAAKPNLRVWCNERNEMREESLLKKKEKKMNCTKCTATTADFVVLIPRSSNTDALVWQLVLDANPKHWCICCTFSVLNKGICDN